MMGTFKLFFKLFYRSNQLKTATLLAIRLHKDINKAFVWMGTPSDLFFNFSPAEYILGGNGKSLIQWLKERVG